MRLIPDNKLEPPAMPDHLPTQPPAPMSEERLKALEQHYQFQSTGDAVTALRLLAEVRRLQAELNGSDQYMDRRALNGSLAVNNQLRAELTAVRAAVTEESQRADRAEAEARELRREVVALRAGATGFDYTNQLLDATAWLLSTGGNDEGNLESRSEKSNANQANCDNLATEDGKENGRG